MADRNDSKNFIESIKNGLLKDKTVRRSEYIFSIIANLILFYIANNIMNWNLSFIAPSFSQVLWAINLSIGVTIFGNILLIIYNPAWLRHIMKVVMNIFALIATYIFFTVFPLTINPTYTLIVQILLILVMIAVIISILFEIFQLLFVSNKSVYE